MGLFLFLVVDCKYWHAYSKPHTHYSFRCRLHSSGILVVQVSNKKKLRHFMHKSATGGKEKIMIIKTMIITSNIFRKIKFLQFETKKVFHVRYDRRKQRSLFSDGLHLLFHWKVVSKKCRRKCLEKAHITRLLGIQLTVLDQKADGKWTYGRPFFMLQC